MECSIAKLKNVSTDSRQQKEQDLTISVWFHESFSSSCFFFLLLSLSLLSHFSSVFYPVLCLVSSSFFVFLRLLSPLITVYDSAFSSYFYLFYLKYIFLLSSLFFGLC